MRTVSHSTDQIRSIHRPMSRRTKAARNNWYRELSRVARVEGSIIGTFGRFGLRLVPGESFAQVCEERQAA